MPPGVECNPHRHSALLHPTNVKTLLFIAIAVVAVGALMAAIPGNPVWKLLNPSKTVAISDPEDTATGPAREMEIISLLPRDAIPAILDLMFVSGAEADAQMRPVDRVIGLSINGDHRAYAIAHLSSHEVVNDTAGGVPVAVTW
jgi:hypothetical protein